MSERFWRYVKYFRGGYSSYIGFAVQMGSFIILFHKFVMPYIPFLKDVNMFVFGVVTLVLLITVSVPLGWLHFSKNPFRQEAIIQWDMNPRTAELTSKVREIYKGLYKQ